MFSAVLGFLYQLYGPPSGTSGPLLFPKLQIPGRKRFWTGRNAVFFIPECCTLRFLSCCCCCCCYSLNCKNLVENTSGQDGMLSFFIPECCILGFLSCCCCYSLAAGTPLGDTEIQVRISFGEGPGGSRGALKGVPGGGPGGLRLTLAI